MNKSPYDFDIDGAIAIILSAGAGIAFSIWGCYSPMVQNLAGVVGAIGGVAAIAESGKVYKSEKRSSLRDMAEDDILIDDLANQYSEVLGGQTYLDVSPIPQQLPRSPLPLPVATNDRNVDELWQRLNQPEYDWLLRMMLMKPLLIWGPQGSGKSQFAQFLALLRVLFFNHRVTVSDPHSHINKWAFPTHGKEYDYAAINEQLKAYYHRLKNPDSPHTSIWDEVTQYDENCNSEESKRFLKSILSDVRKPPEFPILLSHGNTLTALGGGKGGVKRMQIDGLPELELRAKTDRLGNIIPAYCGLLTAKNDEGEMAQQAVIIEPDWMNSDYLIRKFPQLKQTQPTNSNSQSNKGQPRSNIAQSIDLEKPPLDIDVIENEDTNEDLRDRAHSDLPVSDSKIPVSATIAELAQLTGKDESTLKAAIEALKEGKSQTYVIEKILEMKGREYQQGKNLLAMIREYL